ncbi:MAG: lytic transglycosylase domain-containing protein [Thermodesulfobacteriota bacterium]
MEKIRLNSLALKAAPFFIFVFVFFFTMPATSNNELIKLTDMSRFGTFLQTNELVGVYMVLRDFKTGLNTEEEYALAKAIFDQSRAYRIDPFFILAMIKTESSFYNWARSRKGALGMMQILPATGEAMALELGLKWRGEETLFDPSANVRIGIYYLSELRGRFSDDMKIATAAYNRGPTDLSMRLRRGRGLKFRYVDSVYSNYDDMRDNIVIN